MWSWLYFWSDSSNETPIPEHNGLARNYTGKTDFPVTDKELQAIIANLNKTETREVLTDFDEPELLTQIKGFNKNNLRRVTPVDTPCRNPK
jgi:hypothetical protein